MSNHNIEAIFESVLTGIYVYDVVNQNNEFINNQYTEITGWTLEELNGFGEDFLQLFHPDDQDAILKHIEAIVSSKDDESIQTEYRFKHKNGHWVWCLSYDTPHQRDQDGNVTKFIGSFFDISDRKENEEKLKAANEELARMNEAMTGRELKMVELKKELAQLKKQLSEK